MFEDTNGLIRPVNGRETENIMAKRKKTTKNDKQCSMEHCTEN